MMTTNDSLRSLQWDGEALTLLDQTKLPGERVYIRCIDWRVVAEAIKMLRVRGAPAIGVAAAFMALIVRVIKNAFAQAVKMKDELDYTV